MLWTKYLGVFNNHMGGYELIANDRILNEN